MYWGGFPRLISIYLEFAVTSSKENFSLSLKASIIHFIHGWYWHFCKTSSKVTVVPRKDYVSLFKSNSNMVMFTQKECIKFASYFLSLI